MMVGLQRANADKEIARYTYAEPAVQQTRQVVAVGVVMVVVFALALYTLSQHPNAMWAIAEMVSVIGIVFGGIFVAARYVKKRSETPPDYP